MSKSKVVELKNPAVDLLTELMRNGARRLISEAIEIELESILDEVSVELSSGKKRVVRNGYLPEREILTGIGRVNVRVPRILDRMETESKIVFKSKFIPPYMRRSATLNEVLPLLYLKGLSETDDVHFSARSEEHRKLVICIT